MAQFSYEAYAEQQAKKRSMNEGNKGEGSKTQFINSFLKNDGDSVVVRFPYHSISDLNYESTHLVPYPGSQWKRRIRCAGDSCPLCSQGVKTDMRFFVKAMVYTSDDTGKVTSLPGIWDRPAAFADIDIKNLIQEYGDLSDNLFKIKRSGTGLNDTRYSITIILNKTVYNPEIYKKDFTGLEAIDPLKILTKSIEQYLVAIGNKAETEAPLTEDTPKKEVAKVAINEKTEVETAPEKPAVDSTPVSNASSPNGEQRRVVKYTF